MLVCARHSPFWSPILCGLSGYQGPPVGPAVSSCFFYLWHQDGVGLLSQPISPSWLFVLPALWGPPSVSFQRCSLCCAFWWAPDRLCRVLAAETLSFWKKKRESCISKLFITCKVVCKQYYSIITSSRICKPLVIRSQCVFNFLQGTWCSFVLVCMSWLGHNMRWIAMMYSLFNICVYSFQLLVNFLPRIGVCGL